MAKNPSLEPAVAGSSPRKAFVGPIPANYFDLPEAEQRVITGKIATAMQAKLLPKKA